jgi:hypothetical protein
MNRLPAIALLSVFLAACGRAPEMPADAGRYDLGDRVLTSVNAVQPNGGERPAELPQAPAKRIIHTATLALRADDFAKAERRIASLVREASGYVAEFREYRHEGKRTNGNWTTRIPAERFDLFLDQLEDEFVVENKQVDSKEVTEEFVDLTSRLASKQKVEQRVAELLEKRAGEVRDVIAIETELGRVREEVERIEGRLRYLADRTEMTTVTISLRETQRYEAEPSTLTGRVTLAFNQSLSGLIVFGEAILLIVVVCSPWAAAGLVIVLPVGLGLKFRRRKRPI